MSPLRLTGSTSGYSEIDAPAVAGDQTFTLPGTGGTLDRLNRAGNILQVVQGTVTAATAITSTSYQDTGLTASITPQSTSNKILVVISQSYALYRQGTTISGSVTIVRDSTSIIETVDIPRLTAATDGSQIRLRGIWSYSYLDSPSSTSSVTYKTQGKVDITANSGSIEFQLAGANPSSILLLEVAA